MMYRLTQDHGGLAEGSCITEDKFKSVYYLDKPFFEIIQEFEIKDLIPCENEAYCIENGIDAVLFYNEHELNNFLTKTND